MEDNLDFDALLKLKNTPLSTRSVIRLRLHTSPPLRARAEAELGEDGEDVVADAGSGADLRAANQRSAELINEARAEEAPLRFAGRDALRRQPLSLSLSLDQA